MTRWLHDSQAMYDEEELRFESGINVEYLVYVASSITLVIVTTPATMAGIFVWFVVYKQIRCMS